MGKILRIPLKAKFHSKYFGRCYGLNATPQWHRDLEMVVAVSYEVACGLILVCHVPAFLSILLKTGCARPISFGGCFAV